MYCNIRFSGFLQHLYFIFWCSYNLSSFLSVIYFFYIHIYFITLYFSFENYFLIFTFSFLMNFTIRIKKLSIFFTFFIFLLENSLYTFCYFKKSNKFYNNYFFSSLINWKQLRGCFIHRFLFFNELFTIVKKLKVYLVIIIFYLK